MNNEVVSNEMDNDQPQASTENTYTRSQVRSLIFHLLYAMEEFDYEIPLFRIIEGINQGYDQHITPDGEIAKTTQTIIDQRKQIDVIIQDFLEHWRLERLGLCTRLILRLGTWELLATDLPVSIIINEAVELAKDFAEKDSYKFINGILDKIAAQREQLREKFAGKIA
jgi:N utilization substance protein B